MRTLVAAFCLCGVVLTTLTIGAVPQSRMQRISLKGPLDKSASAEKKTSSRPDLQQMGHRDVPQGCPSCGAVDGEIEVSDAEDSQERTDLKVDVDLRPFNK